LRVVAWKLRDWVCWRRSGNRYTQEARTLPLTLRSGRWSAILLLGGRSIVLLLRRRCTVLLLRGRCAILLIMLRRCATILVHWRSCPVRVVDRRWSAIIRRRLLSPLTLLRWWSVILPCRGSAVRRLLLAIWWLLWRWSAIVLLGWRSAVATLPVLLGWRLLIVVVVVEPGHD
jgi:hypothetical protein